MPAWMPSSVNVPSSISSAIRSRAVSLSARVLAGDPLLAAAELRLRAALVQVLDERAQDATAARRCSWRALIPWEVGSYCGLTQSRP